MAEWKHMPVRLLPGHSEVDSGGRQGIQKSPLFLALQIREKKILEAHRGWNQSLFHREIDKRLQGPADLCHGIRNGIAARQGHLLLQRVPVPEQTRVATV